MASDTEDLAALIADTLAMVESLRRTAAEVVPVGMLSGLEAPPPATTPSPSAASPGGDRRAEAPRPPVARAPLLTPTPMPSAPAGAPPGIATATPRTNLFGAKWAERVASPEPALTALRDEMTACTACPRAQSRSRVVPGVGPARALLFVVLDPPDERADATGDLLSVEALGMLEKMLLHVVRVDKREVQVLPVVRCAGPPLTPAHMRACQGFLDRQIALCKPRAILVMGERARKALALPEHGLWGEVAGVPALGTFHPDHLLENPGDKRATMAHLQTLASRVG